MGGCDGLGQFCPNTIPVRGFCRAPTGFAGPLPGFAAPSGFGRWFCRAFLVLSRGLVLHWWAVLSFVPFCTAFALLVYFGFRTAWLFWAYTAYTAAHCRRHCWALFLAARAKGELGYITPAFPAFASCARFPHSELQSYLSPTAYKRNLCIQTLPTISITSLPLLPPPQRAITDIRDLHSGCP